MTVEKKKDIEDRNIKIFRRTDVVSTHVIIFAHGIISSGSVLGSCVGAEAKPFKVPAGKQVHHYIADHNTFTFQTDTWLSAFQGQLEPAEIIVAGKDATNYQLNKAAGIHIETEAAKTYKDLEVEVERSDKAPRAVAVAHPHLLGLGVPCDLVSIRNPNILPGQSLKQIVNHKWMQQYTYFHCFFCRAHADGRDGKSGPNWKGGRRQFK